MSLVRRGIVAPVAVFVLAAVALCWASPVRSASAATDPAAEGRRIVERSKERTNSRTEKITYRMELIGADGDVEQSRKLTSYFRDSGQETVTLLKFLAPRVVEGTGMLVEAGAGEPSDIWVYLPVTRRLRRVSGADKNDRFLGSEFTYEDFEGYRPQAHDFRLLATRPCLDQARCWVVEARPATDGERRASGYDRKVYWIEKESLYPVRVDLYADGAAEPVKRLTATAPEQRDGYWRSAALTMHDLRSDRRTRLSALERAIDTDLDPYHLSRRFLRSE